MNNNNDYSLESLRLSDDIYKALEVVSSDIEDMSEKLEQAFGTAAESQSTMDETITRMKEINLSTEETAKVLLRLKEKSGEIGQYNNMISQIARQTNLLSLNAAIEAARAGEHGRGFSVVADEIGKLAHKAADSAKSIREGINQILGDITLANELIDEEKEKVALGSDAASKSAEAFDSISLDINQAVEYVIKVITSFEDSKDISRKLSQKLKEHLNEEDE